jgi:hypothetical protein
VLFGGSSQTTLLSLVGESCRGCVLVFLLDGGGSQTHSLGCWLAFSSMEGFKSQHPWGVLFCFVLLAFFSLMDGDKSKQQTINTPGWCCFVLFFGFLLLDGWRQVKQQTINTLGVCFVWLGLTSPLSIYREGSQTTNKQTNKQTTPGCLFGWLVGWLIGWLVGWLVGFSPLWRREVKQTNKQSNKQSNNQTIKQTNTQH